MPPTFPLRATCCLLKMVGACTSTRSRQACQPTCWFTGQGEAHLLELVTVHLKLVSEEPLDFCLLQVPGNKVVPCCTADPIFPALRIAHSFNIIRSRPGGHTFPVVGVIKQTMLFNVINGS